MPRLRRFGIRRRLSGFRGNPDCGRDPTYDRVRTGHALRPNSRYSNAGRHGAVLPIALPCTADASNTRCATCIGDRQGTSTLQPKRILDPVTLAPPLFLEVAGDQW